MKKYLVTGAAGFIGANFVKYLLKKWGNDVEIVILDALTYAGNPMTIKDEIKLPNVTFVKGDIGDRELVTKIMNEFDPDFVVNFAAESHVDRSIENPRLFLETNILGTQNMLDCAREAWFAGKDENGHNRYREGKKSCRFPLTRCTAHFPKTLPSRSPCILQMQSRKWSKGARTYRHSATDFSLRTPPSPLVRHTPQPRPEQT